jgi:hypothetical protein
LRNPKIYTITVIPLYAFWKEIICKNYLDNKEKGRMNFVSLLENLLA